MITRDQVVQQAREYLGVRFRMYGRDKQGLDCVGLLYRVLTDLGMEVDDFTDYSRQPEIIKLNHYLDKYSRPTIMNPPRTGQVLKIRQHVFPMHLGLLSVDRQKITVIHANVAIKRVVEQPWAEWRNLIMEHREIIGVR